MEGLWQDQSKTGSKQDWKYAAGQVVNITGLSREAVDTCFVWIVHHFVQKPQEKKMGQVGGKRWYTDRPLPSSFPVRSYLEDMSRLISILNPKT